MKKSLLCVLTLLLVAGCTTTTSSPSESSEVTSSAVVESSTVVESSSSVSSSSSSVSSSTESSSVVIHPTSVTVTSLVSGTLLVGETRLLSATTVPEVVSNPAVSWASSNTALATVAEGLVTAVSAGVVTITATVDGVSGTLEIEVVAPIVYLRPGVEADAVAEAGVLFYELGGTAAVQTVTAPVNGTYTIKFTVGEEGSVTLWYKNPSAESDKTYTVSGTLEGMANLASALINGVEDELLRNVPLNFVRNAQVEKEGKASLKIVTSINNEITLKDLSFVEKVYKDVDITVDGDYADWVDTYAEENTRAIYGSGTVAHKSAVFSASLVEEGLYLFASVEHDVYITNGGAWHTSTNFEFFINGSNQYFVSARNGGETSGGARAIDAYEIVNVERTPEDIERGSAKYHTNVEVFVANEHIAGTIIGNEIKVGIAWKTPGDQCNNGEAAGGGLDEYWVPAGRWTSSDQAFVTIRGFSLTSSISYIPETIATDGDISDWPSAVIAREDAKVVGTGTSVGKTATWYGFIDEKGVYLAVVAHHGVYVTNAGSWYQNTNFEFFINGGNQNYVTAQGGAPGVVSNGAGAIVTTGDAESGYVTVAEWFMPAAFYQSYIDAGLIRVGFAFKTPGDVLFGGGGTGVGGGDDWWYAVGHTPGTLAQQFYVYTDGVYATAKG
jgi:hypothetical protein